MSFENFEFPNTNFYNSDLRELIAMYKKLVKEYDGIVQQLNDIRDNIEQIVDTYLDKDLSQFKAELLNVINNELTEMKQEVRELQREVRKEIDEYKGEVEESLERLNAELRQFETKIDNRIQTIENQITKVYLDMAEYKHEMRSLFELEKNILIQYINEHITQITRLYVVNPYTGKYEDVQEVLNQMAGYVTSSYGLTADEYDKLQLTASAYDAKRITAIEYSSRGILKFFRELYMKLRSPWTGEFDYYDNVIYKLVDLQRQSYTATEYDELQLTADDYDVLELTAYYYDWEITPKTNPQLLIDQLKSKLVNVVEVGAGGTGLSATQYNSLKLLGYV